MAKVDRLGWAAGFSFNGFGMPFGIRVNDASILDTLLSELPSYCVLNDEEIVRQLLSLRVGPASQVRGVQNYHLAYVGSTQVVRSLDIAEVRHKLWRNVEHICARASQDYVFVRAGVVSWQGKAIVIPGGCKSGKTTLVAELVKAGCDYFSDEYAVFDKAGRVHPFPRALSLREVDGTTQRVSVESIGGRQALEAMPVACVVSTSYDAQAAWGPQPISAGRIAVALTQNAVAVRHRSEDYLDSLVEAARNAIGWQGTRGESAPVSQALLQILERHSSN